MQLKELISLHEGIKLKPYRCTAGKLTIGIGRNLDENGINQDEAQLLFENDINRCIKQLNAEFSWFSRLGEVRQAVLIDMCFNLGINGLCNFKDTLKLIENGRYKEASKEMLNSLWAEQVKDRAIQLSNMMSSGEWPV